MRAAYICVLIAGLVDPSVASSQGTSSFGPSETAAIQQLFDGYTVAFRAEDYARLREYIQAPFVRFGPSNTRAETEPGDWVVLRTLDDAIGFFRTASGGIEGSGC